jgi:hypothetical protein
VAFAGLGLLFFTFFRIDCSILKRREKAHGDNNPSIPNARNRRWMVGWLGSQQQSIATATWPGGVSGPFNADNCLLWNVFEYGWGEEVFRGFSPARAAWTLLLYHVFICLFSNQPRFSGEKARF